MHLMKMKQNLWIVFLKRGRGDQCCFVLFSEMVTYGDLNHSTLIVQLQIYFIILLTKLYSEEKMELSQSRNDFPALKKLHFAESVQQLHRYNTHVAQVSFNTTQSMSQSYNDKKDQYQKITQMRYDEKSKVLQELEQLRKKSLQTKQREIKRRNQENLAKIQHYLNERRNKITNKEKQLMEESSARREQYLHNLASSFHHSQDKRNKIKIREENQFQRSLLLFQKNQEKIRVANQRKAEILQEVRTAFKIKNQSILSSTISSCKQKQNSKKDQEVQKLIQKYDAVNKKLMMIDTTVLKRVQDKKKQEEKLFERHRHRRTALEQQKFRKIEEDVKKDEFKIDKANMKKEQNLQQSVLSMQFKRKQKEKQFLQNNYYIQEEVDKKMNKIIHKHHQSLVNLAHSKSEKERLVSYNLHDSFRSTLRS